MNPVANHIGGILGGRTENGPGGAGNTVTQGLTPEKEGLHMSVPAPFHGDPFVITETHLCWRCYEAVPAGGIMVDYIESDGCLICLDCDAERAGIA